MGQQQFLFLALCICILGIYCSARLIDVQGKSQTNREVIINDLYQIADEAQKYYRRLFENDGGDGSFIGLSKGVRGIQTLQVFFPTSHGEFFVSKSGTESYVQILAVGVERGRDPSVPMRVLMTVWADSTAVFILN